jgi:error-prone DNA polymerase
MPDVFERYRPLVRGSSFLLARGRVERSGPVVNVRVVEVKPLPLEPAIPSVSRDFH